MKPIKIFFAGDFCSKPSTKRIVVSEDLKHSIQSCNLKVVNFEVPLKPSNPILQSGKSERFYQSDDAPDFLRGLGFNLFQLANNHTFDWDAEGFLKTKAVLGVEAFGAGTYDEAYTMKVCEVDGVKIGFIALTFAAYKGVFDDVMNHEGLGCAYINDLRVNHDIMEAKKHVDFLFVLPHDGIEYIDVPMPETIARYHDFIDYGADAVIASHPHCPQGWEEYKGKPVFYSLGNFLFNSKEGYDYRATNRPHWYEGICVIMTIEDGKLSWDVLNTKNVGNTGIEIDKSEARSKHNHSLCKLLKDPTAYRETLMKECRKLSEEQEMPIIDKTFHDRSLKATAKHFVKYCIKYVLRKKRTDDSRLSYLLKNETRKALILRSMR